MTSVVIARLIPNGPGKTVMAFDLVTANDKVIRNIHEKEAPEGISQEQWEFHRLHAFQRFCLMTEVKGTYNGKSWDIRKNRDYYDILTEQEITEIIMGQYYYDTCVCNPPIPKLSHPLRIASD